MIQLPNVPLPREAQRGLDRYQALIDGLTTYAKQVEEAKRLFPRRNRAGNRVFREVRRRLLDMCSGAERCCYCEDSASDAVEHIRPKDVYPEQTFVWENYLYACRPCNGPKSNRFAVIEPGKTTPTEVARSAGDPVVPPPQGEYALIDPRAEDPLSFMMLDLRQTFRFVELHPQGTIAYARANYTIEVLRLNERDLLPKARGGAYTWFRSVLGAYRRKRDGGKPRSQLNELIAAILVMPHRTVWEEMKRQRTYHPELDELFADVPEALRW